MKLISSFISAYSCSSTCIFMLIFSLNDDEGYISDIGLYSASGSVNDIYGS